jgi:hypothetical protein
MLAISDDISVEDTVMQGFEVAPCLSVGCRVVVPDIETCDFMAGTADLDEYRRSNIRA